MTTYFLTENLQFWLFDLSISCVCNWNVEYKAYNKDQTGSLKIFFLLKWNKNQKCERPNEIRGEKMWTYINPNAQK